MKGQTSAAIPDLLNLRTGPGTGYPVITALPPGSIVFLLEEKTDNWQHVATTVGGGWVFRSYIQPVQCPPPPVTQDVPDGRAKSIRRFLFCGARAFASCRETSGSNPPRRNRDGT
jgi:hypothetical protein